jgi:hypothetical protein
MLILFKRRVSDAPVISTRIQRRRLFTAVSLVFLLFFSALLISSKYYNTSTKAFSADTTQLVVNSDEMLYLGSSQNSGRIWGSVAEPYTAAGVAVAISPPATYTYPTDSIYTNQYFNIAASTFGSHFSSTGCPTKFNQKAQLIPSTSPERNQTLDYSNPYSGMTCYAMISHGDGMILRYSQKITINGTLFLGDRVVLEAPEIIIGPTAKIFGNGQDGQLGYGDDCGAGGIGASQGGTNSSGGISLPGDSKPAMAFWSCSSPQPGVQGSYSLITGSVFQTKAIASYFNVNGQYTQGGAGADGTYNSSLSKIGGGKLSGDIGVGGSGGSGATSSSTSVDHGSSGGGGGGFGLVFHASKTLDVSNQAIVTVAGGNSNSIDGSAQWPYLHAKLAEGGFGGPGGGGVIIIDTPNIIFGGGTEVPNYNVFNVQGGDFYHEQNLQYKMVQIPEQASPGALIVKSAGYSKIAKTVSPENVNPGQVVTVTLTIPVASGSYSVVDEFLNDGDPVHPRYFTLDGALPPGCSSDDGKSLTCPNTTASPIVYHLKAPTD